MRRAPPLYAAGGAALALLPVAMVLANRSSPILVAVAALAFLGGRWREEPRALPGLLVAPLRTPLGLACLAFLGWSVLSIAWSPFPALSLRVLGEFLPTLIMVDDLRHDPL